MTHFIKPEYLVSLYLILNKQEEVSLKDLGNYGEKLNKELKEQMIEALFLYSDKYIDEMLSDYKDYFEYNGLYEDVSSPDYCIPWIKRKVSNEELSEKFTSYLSNDVLKVASDLKAKEKTMTTEQKIEVMKAYLEGKTIQCKKVTNNDDRYDWYDCDDWPGWYDCNPAWDWTNFEYRVKSEPTYRPYKNLEEFKQDIVRKYGGSKFENILETRNIWLKSKCKEFIGQIVKLTTDNVFVDGSDKSWLCVFNYYSYLDGTPFGIKE